MWLSGTSTSRRCARLRRAEAAKDGEQAFRAIHTAYVDAVCNPFASLSLEATKGPSPPIKSKRFDAALDAIVYAHNARPS
jgi:hypothetical protein